MKASELIAKLQKLIEERGDLNVGIMQEASAYVPDDVTYEELCHWQKKAYGFNHWFVVE